MALSFCMDGGREAVMAVIVVPSVCCVAVSEVIWKQIQL